MATGSQLISQCRQCASYFNTPTCPRCAIPADAYSVVHHDCERTVQSLTQQVKDLEAKIASNGAAAAKVEETHKQNRELIEQAIDLESQISDLQDQVNVLQQRAEAYRLAGADVLLSHPGKLQDRE